MTKQQKQDIRGVQVTLLRAGRKWIFAIPAGFFRQPFISKGFPSKRAAIHAAIELIAQLQGASSDPDQIG